MAEKLQQIEQLSDALNVKIDGIFDNGAELASLKALQSEGYTVEKKITVVYHPIQTSEVILTSFVEAKLINLYVPYIRNKEDFPTKELEAMLTNAIKDLKRDNPKIERFCLVRGENTVEVYTLYKNK